MKAPDMRGKVGDITDPLRLYARLGYHVYLQHVADSKGEAAKAAMYGGYIKPELTRLAELAEAEKGAQTA